jgi:cell division protein FtsB
MAATPGDRRTPGRRPARSGPGGAGRPERKRAERDRAATVARVREEEQHRSRLTGRAAILVLVLAVLAVSSASYLRAYLQQRHHLEDLRAEVAEREASIDDLQQETERRKDPAFITKEARELGYIWPGETPYVVVDGGAPLTDSELDDPDSVGEQEERAWYDDVWTSVEVAGDPPTRIPPPPDERVVDSEDE